MGGESGILVAKTLSEIYGEGESHDQAQRWAQHVHDFETRFETQPKYCVRAPGRVNILGEHVDYSLFPVLPAAIKHDILIAVGITNTTTITISNTDPKVDDLHYNLIKGEHGWIATDIKGLSSTGSYALSAILECLDHFYVTRNGVESADPPVGMNWLVTGNIPQGAGLSSSAAFIVSVVLAFLVAGNLLDQVTQRDVVRLALAAEHRLGLNNGGLDHAASVMASAGSLTHLEFVPAFTPTIIPLPPSLAIVVSNSLATHSLQGAGASDYNIRVIECLSAAKLLSKSWHTEAVVEPETDPRPTLRQVLQRAPFYDEKDEEGSLRHALSTISTILNPSGIASEGWTAAQIQEVSGLSGEEFDRLFPEFKLLKLPGFQLYLRAQHTFEESLRVIEFTKLCESVSASSKSTSKDIAKLGRLLSATHDSLRDIYHATVPQVDRLQELCLKNGSLGSRQTGGGWGGAVISLIPTDQTEAFIDSLKKQFEPYQHLDADGLDRAIFVATPGGGAAVCDISTILPEITSA